MRFASLLGVLVKISWRDLWAMVDQAKRMRGFAKLLLGRMHELIVLLMKLKMGLRRQRLGR